MGIRLAIEAADRHSPPLTWREKCVLIIFAISAIDATRECPPGIEDRPEIISRLGLSRTQRYAVIASLVEKGALLRMERGRNGVKAVYAIAPSVTIPGFSRPGEPDGEPVENPAKGPGTRDASAPAKGPGSESEGSRKPGPKGPSNRDAAPSYKEFKGFKTGGGTPPPPGMSPILFGLPTPPLREGDSPEAGNPPRNDDPKRELAAEIRKTRPDWSPRSIIRALDRALASGREWPLVAEAMRVMAADQATQHPGRLEHDGPWWAEAARRLRTGRATAPSGVHEYDHNPDTDRCRVCQAPAENWHHPRRRTA